MRKPDKPIVCYVTDRKSLSRSEPIDPVAKLVVSMRMSVELDARIRMAIDAGADWIQIREKDLAGRRLLKLTRNAIAAADERASQARATRTRIFVNDRLDVALAARAAGVHLGGESVPVERAVRWCRGGNAPPDFQVGVSCHSIDRAREAEQAGANYIFFGPVFDTPSKRPFGPPQGLDRLAEICRAIQIPVIAIGGVDQSNAQDCIRAGASGIAAIRLFQDPAYVGELGVFISTITGHRATSGLR